MNRLEEIEAIKQLKYRYLRYLDTKQWAELKTLFTDDAVCAYDKGRYTYHGRDDIIGFLEGALGRKDILSLHQCHHPEIDVTGDTTAKGTWYLQDMVINVGAATEALKPDFILWGAAFYEDEYVKVGGEWKIKSTGYERTFEQHLQASDLPTLLVRSRWDPE
jgi:hypothetical protein